MKHMDRIRSGIPTLIAPVKRSDDILPILRAGAKEVYGGIIDSKWDEEFGQYIEMNRRSAFGKKANMNGCDELCEAVRICKEHDAEFHLTLNALQIPQKYYSYLKPVLHRFFEAGGEKVIVSDPAIIPVVLSFGLQPVISSCADVLNIAAASFYKEQKFKRIIFPRYMLLDDIEHITEAVSDIEYEAFLMNGACRFHDGCCFCMHGTTQNGLCDTLDYTPYHLIGNSSQCMMETAEQRHEQFKQSYYRACGLCALFRLSRCVDSLKIVGRNADLNSIVSDIQLAKRNLEIVLECLSEEEFMRKLIKPRDEEVRCRNHSNCYYLQ